MRSTSSASTSTMLSLLQSPPRQQKKCVKYLPLISQAFWNITLSTTESAYSIATFITDTAKLTPYAFGMSKLGMVLGGVGGLLLGGSETYSHWAQGSHFSHADSHEHEEEVEVDNSNIKLSWTQSIASAFHYVSDSIAGTAFPLMAYKTLLSMAEDESPSPAVYVAIGACSLFCNLQTLINTRSAFKKENERENEELVRGPMMV